MNGNKTYKRREVADIFKVRIETIDNWRENGIIKAIKIGPKAIRFTQEEVDRLMAMRDGTDN